DLDLTEQPNPTRSIDDRLNCLNHETPLHEHCTEFQPPLSASLGFGKTESSEHFLAAGCEYEMALKIEFHVPYHYEPPLCATVDRHEPALRCRIERRVARIGHMANIIEQVISHPVHGVHTRTPRYPAMAHAARKSSSLARRSGPFAGSWNITSSCVKAKAT